MSQSGINWISLMLDIIREGCYITMRPFTINEDYICSLYAWLGNLKHHFFRPNLY